MKAAVISDFGTTDVLTIVDLPRPEPGTGELLVRVRAAAINPKDTFIRKGRFRRQTGEHFPMGTGFDFAGEVAGVGRGPSGLIAGDRVYGMLDGWQGGTCAEYVVARAEQLALMPANLSFVEAAALPLVSLTALQALRDEADIDAGRRVAINGASGGVGSMAVQVAKLYEADVTAISSRHNHDFLLALGADRCIDYNETDVTQLAQPFDIFFDVFGNRPFREVKNSLSKRGVWVSTVLRGHVWRSVVWTRIFGRKKARLVVVKASTADLRLVRGWVEAGSIKPIIHTVYPLSAIAEAHAQQETKHTRGKNVVRILD